MSERWPGQPAKVGRTVRTRSRKRSSSTKRLRPRRCEEERAAAAPRAGDEQQHAYGELDIPDDVNLIEGEPDGTRRGVAIVAARFNGEIVNKLLESALEELHEAGVRRDAITVMPVPGAFELPLAAMALAKTRRLRAWSRSAASSAARRRTSSSSRRKRRAASSSRRWRPASRSRSAS